MRKPDREYWLQNENLIEQITSRAVGFPVKVYWGDSSITGLSTTDGYQLMPATDETAAEFWSWHLETNPQWYESPLEASAAFVQAWQNYSRRASSS